MKNDVSDEMNFTCVAENQFGIDSRTVSIKLVGKTKITFPRITVYNSTSFQRRIYKKYCKYHEYFGPKRINPAIK